MKLILLLVVLWGLWKSIPYLLLLFEKEHVRNDLTPKPYTPGAWKSEYLDGKMAEAAALELVHCGDYFTASHSSVVKGPLLLYRTPDGQALAALISARFGKAELEKVEVQSRFRDGTALRTSDNFMLPDITGGIEKNTCYRAPLAELLDSHRKRVHELGRTPDTVTTDSAFSLLERIEIERGERMVAMGYARWTDPAHTKLRRTIKGVKAAAQANQSEKQRVIDSAAVKIEAAQEDADASEAQFGDRPDLTPEQDAFFKSAIQEHNRNTESLMKDWGFADATECGFDQSTGLFTMKLKDGSRVEASGQIYGSFSEADRSWEWAWNNPHIAEPLKKDSAIVHEYARRESLPHLYTGQMPVVDETMITYFVAIAEKLSGAQGMYPVRCGKIIVFIGLKSLTRK